MAVLSADSPEKRAAGFGMRKKEDTNAICNHRSMRRWNCPGSSCPDFCGCHEKKGSRFFLRYHGGCRNFVDGIIRTDSYRGNNGMMQGCIRS